MSKMIESIQTLPADLKSQNELNDAYTARAIELCALERRMHTLELQARGSSPSRSLV